MGAFTSAVMSRAITGFAFDRNGAPDTARGASDKSMPDDIASAYLHMLDKARYKSEPWVRGVPGHVLLKTGRASGLWQSMGTKDVQCEYKWLDADEHGVEKQVVIWLEKCFTGYSAWKTNFRKALEQLEQQGKEWGIGKFTEEEVQEMTGMDSYESGLDGEGLQFCNGARTAVKKAFALYWDDEMKGLSDVATEIVVDQNNDMIGQPSTRF